MQRFQQLFKQLKQAGKDENFLHGLEQIEGIVSKVLSIAMILVILVAIGHLIVYLLETLFSPTTDSFSKTLFNIFGLFLNVLIALEILENITAYLKKHVIQVELVIVTSLIAVARKIIILDLEKTPGLEVIGLAVAIFSLSTAFSSLVRYNNSNE